MDNRQGEVIQVLRYHIMEVVYDEYLVIIPFNAIALLASIFLK